MFLVFQATFAEPMLVHSVLIRQANPISPLVPHSSGERGPLTCQVLLHVKSCKQTQRKAKPKDEKYNFL